MIDEQERIGWLIDDICATMEDGHAMTLLERLSDDTLSRLLTLSFTDDLYSTIIAYLFLHLKNINYPTMRGGEWNPMLTAVSMGKNHWLALIFTYGRDFIYDENEYLQHHENDEQRLLWVRILRGHEPGSPESRHWATKILGDTWAH